MDEQGNSDMATPKRRRKGVPWRHDSIILARLPDVERRHLSGQYNTVIAAALGVDEGTIRQDLKHLEELWQERIKATQDSLRARKVAELEDIKRLSLEAAKWDMDCERAVLFGDLEEENVTMLQTGKPAKRSVYRDEKGSASFRGQKAQALNVARQATMDQAKVLGLVVEKVAPTDPSGEKEYAGLTDEERVARALALLDRARERAARQAAEADEDLGAPAGTTDGGIPE